MVVKHTVDLVFWKGACPRTITSLGHSLSDKGKGNRTTCIVRVNIIRSFDQRMSISVIRN